jgi:hypothetical protein
VSGASVVDIGTLVNAKDPSWEEGLNRKYHVIYGAEIARPRPPKAWLCEALRIAPGAVTIFGGAGFGGKTLALQSLALSVASGLPLWGQFDVRQGKVLHLDWEQDELTVTRYQRLARDMHVDLEDLADLLGTSLLPEAYLDDNDGERALAHLCHGVTLLIIDAFRGAFPTANENDSGVRRWLDMLHRVSKKTGTTIIVIAHSRKMNADVDVRSSLRGSGALFDAAATVYQLDGSPNKPTQVHNTKERHTGKLRESFGLRFVDVQGLGPEEGEFDDTWGLRVEYLSPEEVQAEYGRDDVNPDVTMAVSADRMTTAGERVLRLLACSPDGLTMATMKGLLTGTVNGPTLAAVMPELIKAGGVYVEGRGTSATYHHVPAGREPGED